MTNYNERLDEILTTCDFEPEGFNSRICKWCGERKGMKIHTAKQAILTWHNQQLEQIVIEARIDELDRVTGILTTEDDQGNKVSVFERLKYLCSKLKEEK